MKKTWCSRMLLRMPVRSSFFCSTGPQVVVMGTSSSSAMMRGQRGFAQPGRAVEQHVVHGFAALAGGFDGDGEILFQLGLSGEIGEAARAQPGFKLRVIGLAIAGNQLPVGHVLSA